MNEVAIPLRHRTGLCDRCVCNVDGPRILPPDGARRHAGRGGRFLSMTVDSDGGLSEMMPGRFRRAARSSQVAPLRKAWRASSAPCSVSLTTPAKLPSRTTAIRPATARAPSSFKSPASRALSGRSTGRAAFPVTHDRGRNSAIGQTPCREYRTAELNFRPARVASIRGFGRASGVASRSARLPRQVPNSWADMAGVRKRRRPRRQCVDIDAQPLRRLLKKDPVNRAGMTQRTARLLDREAARSDASLGLPAVDARTICTRDRSMSSSSAAICASAVTMPCPISTFPGATRECPGAREFTMDGTGSPREAHRQFRRGRSGGLLVHLACILGGAQHRPHHAIMRTATAEVAVERPRFPGLSATDFASTAPLRSSGCPENHKAWYQRLFGDEGALQRVGLLVRSQSLDGDDILVRDRPERRIAGGYRAIARATLAGAAAGNARG